MQKSVDWKSATDYRPVTSCQVVVIMNYGYVCTVPYSKRHEQFNCMDSYSSEEAKKLNMTNNVEYWAYLHYFL